MARKTFLFKVVVLGESGVGKTSLLQRYVENQFTIATKSTIGSDFMAKDIEVDGKSVTLQIWDTAGQERYQGIGTSYYRGAEGVMFVFDCTRRQTFDELEQWRKAFLIQVNQEGNDEFPMIIACNKIDRADERVVSVKEVREWCQNRNLSYIETSAKDSTGVEDAFKKLASNILSHTDTDIAPPSTVKLGDDKKDSTCC